MAKPLQGHEMSAVTVSVSVSCLPVLGSAAEQVSLETRLKQLQPAGSMPVVQPRRKNIVQNLSQSGQRQGHHPWMIVVRFCHRQLTPG